MKRSTYPWVFNAYYLYVFIFASSRTIETLWAFVRIAREFVCLGRETLGLSPLPKSTKEKEKTNHLALFCSTLNIPPAFVGNGLRIKLRYRGSFYKSWRK